MSPVDGRIEGRRIDGRARNVRELLDNAKYTIDFYQREYVWREQEVRELIDDLTGKFLDFYDAGHERSQVKDYGHYFLGSIVISHKRGQRFIVDGQQRLTTLTLLLIYLHHLRADLPDDAKGRDVQSLIYSESYGTRSFNLDVDERVPAMQALLAGQHFDPEGQPESVQNIAARYEDIATHFPEEIDGHALPYFVDWLIENVHLVEIEAYSDEDAYTIFETMNDRGLSLSLPDMLKGYVLANIRAEQDQRLVNGVWKTNMERLRGFGKDAESDFFKDWLRARHAQTIRPGGRGAENRDYERISSEFHRWIRDQKDRLGLTNSDSFIRFVRRDMDFYARQFVAIKRATETIVPGWESIRYNEDRGFTLQTQAMLAPLSPSDAAEDIQKKVALVADFLDIWLARRVWNFRTIAYSSVLHTLFVLSRDIRGLDVESLASYLRQQLDEQPETFAREPRFRLHQQNYRQVRHILARITHWVDVQCGLASHFEDFVSQGQARPFEIEHIWADKYERYAEHFSHPNEFAEARNHIGGLLLLQRGLNQSLGDATYEDKRDAYVSHGQNLLARSLHPLAYNNNPAFAQLIDETGLPFQPYDRFGPEEQVERQKLYIRIAEWVWNPSRLSLHGESPPTPEPIWEPTETKSSIDKAMRDDARYRFSELLLAKAKAKHDLHANVSPGPDIWVTVQRHKQLWNYVVMQDEVRMEAYFDSFDAATNKALFDRLFADKAAIQEEFGALLLWQRLDERKACRISFTIEGGWGEESLWPETTSKAADAMHRLYAVLGPRIQSILEE